MRQNHHHFRHRLGDRAAMLQATIQHAEDVERGRTPAFTGLDDKMRNAIEPVSFSSNRR